MIEHEVKLAVWPGFVLPPLDDVVPGALAVPAAEKRQDAVYHDTPDLRLARAGITLRHRSDDGWTLKLPDRGGEGPGIRRDEIIVEGAPRSVPESLRERIAARVRTATVGPVARLQTVRRPTELVDQEGAVLAEIVDDEVSVLDGRHVALRFRELEVELGESADPAVLDAVVARLRSGGAGLAEPTPKVLRALGPRALDPPELAPPSLGPKPTAAEVLTAGLTRSVQRLIEHDPGVRVGGDDEAVHQARVATRRLRSDLRTYVELLDPDWALPLRDELRWLADLLGEVRDADVLDMRLRRQLDGLRRPDRVVGSALLERLAAERSAARDRLLAALGSERYLVLLDQLVEGAGAPRMAPGGRRPVAEVLPRLAAGPWAAFQKRARRLGATSADGEYHEVRVRAKHARYAAEVAALVLGRPAQRLADRLGQVQDVLGAHQDACVARDWLRQAALGVEAPVAFVAGQLAVRQDLEAEARRAEWPAVWKKASKGKLRAWLKP